MTRNPLNATRQTVFRCLAVAAGAGAFVLIAARILEQYNLTTNFGFIGFPLAGGCGAAFGSILWRRIAKVDVT